MNKDEDDYNESILVIQTLNIEIENMTSMTSMDQSKI